MERIERVRGALICGCLRGYEEVVRRGVPQELVVLDCLMSELAERLVEDWSGEAEEVAMRGSVEVEEEFQEDGRMMLDVFFWYYGKGLWGVLRKLFLREVYGCQVVGMCMD